MKLLTNGIFIVPSARAAALSIDETGLISRIYKSGEMLPHADEMIDLHGNFVIPAFEDPHNHIATRARTVLEIDLRNQDISWSEAKERIADRLKKAADDQWVVCHGWNETAWGAIEQSELDALSAHHGIFIINILTHGGLVNTKGAELLAQKNITTGIHGRITEHDFESVSIATSPDAEAYMTAIPALQRTLLSLGIGAMHDMNILTFEQLEAYQKLDQAQALLFPVLLYLNARLLTEPDRIGKHLQAPQRSAQIAGLKLYMDGAIGVSTAAVTQAYADGTGEGLLRIQEHECIQTIAKAASVGLKHVAIHCIGDRAIDSAVRVFEAMRDEYADRITTWRFEHFEMPSNEAIQKVARLGGIASMQPNFSWDVGNYGARLGSRVETINPLRTILDSGATLAIGSDAAPSGPIIGMRWATVDAPYPCQKISVAEALKCYTEIPAHIAGVQDRRGKIAVGYEANFTVLNQDPLVEENWKKENNMSLMEMWVRGKKI